MPTEQCIGDLVVTSLNGAIATEVPSQSWTFLLGRLSQHVAVALS